MPNENKAQMHAINTLRLFISNFIFQSYGQIVAYSLSVFLEHIARLGMLR